MYIIEFIYYKKSGDIGVFHVGATTIQLCGLMKGGHSDIVRACTWNHEVIK